MLERGDRLFTSAFAIGEILVKPMESRQGWSRDEVDEFNKEHFDKCFANVYEGYKLNPKNTDLAGYMARMEREANRKLNDSPSCDTVYFAMTITAPDSPTHKKALEHGRKQGCPDLEAPKPEAE